MGIENEKSTSITISYRIMGAMLDLSQSKAGVGLQKSFQKVSDSSHGMVLWLFVLESKENRLI